MSGIDQRPAYGNPIKRAAGWVYNCAPLLLILTMTFWAGNGLMGKWLALDGDLPPVAAAFLRWSIALVPIIPLAAPHIRRDWPMIKRHIWPLILLAVFGITAFNTLVYWSQYKTTAVNLFLLNATIPLLTPAVSYLLFRDRITRVQALAVGLALVGALTIILQGDISTLLTLTVNQGDAVILTAMAGYAIYSACLRLRPAIHPMSLLAVLFVLGNAFLLPFYLWEHVYVAQVVFTPKTLIALAYIGIFPSFLAYLCFNRGVELMGANRASAYFHLMPVLGTISAVILFGEAFALFHIIGTALIVAGLILGTRRQKAASD
ncbi:MAG: DMT family transporter [Pseudomonadota bacterium]